MRSDESKGSSQEEKEEDDGLEPHLEEALQRVEDGESLNLFSLSTRQIRAFHMSWFAYFLAFFGWFGIAPLMPIIRDDLQLTTSQLGNTVIASVAISIIARPAAGWLCDRYGPRLTYTGLLCLGAIPLIGVGLSQNYETLLLMRLAIGVLGVGFIVTQHHSTLMFSTNVVGKANAATGGLGGLGGGAAQFVMPVIVTGLVVFGFEEFLAWRLAMIVPGLALLLMGIAYFVVTEDTAFGSFSQLRSQNRMFEASGRGVGFRTVALDYRVWVLFFAYAACGGAELTFINVVALYFYDNFQLSLRDAGLLGAVFGLLSVLAIPLGGMVGDWGGMMFGSRGRVTFLGLLLLLQAASLLWFASTLTLSVAILSMVVFGMSSQMAAGATYSVVPFVNRPALGAVAGVVGSGASVGAFGFGFLLRTESLTTSDVLIWIAALSALAALVVLMLRFSFRAHPIARRSIRRLARLVTRRALRRAVRRTPLLTGIRV